MLSALGFGRSCHLHIVQPVLVDQEGHPLAVCEARLVTVGAVQSCQRGVAVEDVGGVIDDVAGGDRCRLPPHVVHSSPRPSPSALQFDVFGPNREPSTLQEWQEHSKSCEAVLILEFSSVYFQPRQYGIAATVRAVQYFPRDKLTGEVVVHLGGSCPAAVHVAIFRCAGYSFVATPSTEVADQDTSPEQDENLRQALSFAGGAPLKRPAPHATESAKRQRLAPKEQEDEEEPELQRATA